MAMSYKLISAWVDGVCQKSFAVSDDLWLPYTTFSRRSICTSLFSLENSSLKIDFLGKTP